MADTAPLNGYQSSTESIAENRQKYAKYFESGDKSSLTMDDFYSLLMAEMSNQDPMEPMSNTEFISQMASFTSLKNQQDSLYYSNANYAQSLVGKTVTVAQFAGSEMFTDTGIVTSMNLTGGEFNVKVNGRDYQLSSIMEVLPSDNPYSITGNDGAYATSLIGKKVTVSARTDSGDVVEEGIVQRIEIKDNEITVVIENIAYKLSDVVKVELAEAADKTTPNTETDENTPVNETPADDTVVETAPIEETDTADGTEQIDEEDIPDLVPEGDEVVDSEESSEDLRTLFE